ncbi:WXG100 family type VII secretion target [Clostridium intestinale]|uniref:ESAT-6-like protein n=1 Tax=Clostridium intestinale TaxID=36845 RepID=A0A7D6VTG2_9CLOT|nr:WXG100 family type VII secretion target [Clostridium intestinale]QLY81488.1 WXG100 family type VII secretion target [Clostridium intestinale]
MAGNIKITPQELRASSNKFKSKASEIEGTIRQLDSEVKKLSSSWAGAAQSTFFQTFDQLAKGPMKQFVTVTQQISQQLADVAKTMEEVDKQIASKLKL